MKIVITNRFTKDVIKELNNDQKIEIAAILDAIQSHSRLTDIADLKKMKGHKTAFRIKFGEFRIGFLFEDGIIKLSRVLHRNEIYRFFP